MQVMILVVVIALALLAAWERGRLVDRLAGVERKQAEIEADLLARIEEQARLIEELAATDVKVKSAVRRLSRGGREQIAEGGGRVK